ncbi:MAG: protein-L-isoaspartate(D-aspartate) O-methyltransferase [Dehalococcoidia bacterium]|nr:protein-L-isoaspartate(D-aspartate) O-methyltransferase [Dehalococcoidia bacterium]
MDPDEITDTEYARRSLLKKLAEDVSDDRVLDAMRRVPRERFVTPATADLAYQDIALPIAAGQTISQPTIVAIMVSELELRRSDKALEIGAGSGYQAAILSELAKEVITLERIPELAESARSVLSRLGYRNVRVELAGPRLGREEDAPYNAIIVAAAAPRLPLSLLDQMETGGRLVVPVGDKYEQTLMKVVKSAKGFTTRTVTACRFVPLIAEDAWPDDSAVSTVL